MLKKIAVTSYKIFELVVFAIVGYGICIPLAYFTPKRNTVVFIPRFKDSYSGNVKELFVYADNTLQNDQPSGGGSPAQAIYLCESGALYRQLREKRNIIRYPSFRSFGILLRTRLIVVEGNEWVDRFKYHLLFYAQKVQLWHGSGMKKIGKMKPKVANETLSYRLKRKIRGDNQSTHYDLVSFTSESQKRVRSAAFNHTESIVNGQPRNDILFRENILQHLDIGTDKEMIRECLNRKENGSRIALYAPTWRYSKDNEQGISRTIDFERLNRELANHDIVFVIKMHGKQKELLNLKTFDHILEYDRSKDAYPFMAITDLLVTDYSSIYSDYLLLDKPVIFFPFDYDTYVNRDRDLQNDYFDLVPGPVCMDQDSLVQEMICSLQEDKHREARARNLDHHYTYKGGASSKRVWDHICSNYLREARK